MDIWHIDNILKYDQREVLVASSLVHTGVATIDTGRQVVAIPGDYTLCLKKRTIFETV